MALANAHRLNKSTARASAGKQKETENLGMKQLMSDPLPQAPNHERLQNEGFFIGYLSIVIEKPGFYLPRFIYSLAEAVASPARKIDAGNPSLL